MAQATVNGSCLCNGVQYTVSGTDKGAVLCHCSNCRRASGSAFMYNTRLLKSTIDFSKGAELVKKYDDGDTKTGNHLYRHFCSDCGSPLFLQSKATPGLTVVHCGTIADTEPRKPKFELFEEDKRTWIGKLAGAKI